MYRKISADKVHTVSGSPIVNGVLVLDQKGKVLEVGERSEYDAANLEIYEGVLVPGFVNTHCHLELSHLKDRVPTGTGLIPFLKQVVQFRDVPQELIQQAIIDGDKEMYNNGIVAVGDISNTADTAACKLESPIRYATFIEMFDFWQPGLSQPTFDKGKEVYEAHSGKEAGNRKALVAHAPYTVTPRLMELISEFNPEQSVMSIHNQETAHEDQLFIDKTGDFLGFYEHFNFQLDALQPSGKSSIYYPLEYLRKSDNNLFVHNTMTTKEDIEAAHSFSDNVYWVSCPNANLYIENRLPNYQAFIDAKARVALGTDSLSSNWQLSILEEMKTIARFQSGISTEILIKWATLNGAKALGWEAQLGSIEIGKAPGINLLTELSANNISYKTKVQRLV